MYMSHKKDNGTLGNLYGDMLDSVEVVSEKLQPVGEIGCADLESDGGPANADGFEEPKLDLSKMSKADQVANFYGISAEEDEEDEDCKDEHKEKARDKAAELKQAMKDNDDREDEDEEINSAGGEIIRILDTRGGRMDIIDQFSDMQGLYNWIQGDGDGYDLFDNTYTDPDSNWADGAVEAAILGNIGYKDEEGESVVRINMLGKDIVALRILVDDDNEHHEFGDGYHSRSDRDEERVRDRSEDEEFPINLKKIVSEGVNTNMSNTTFDKLYSKVMENYEMEEIDGEELDALGISDEDDVDGEGEDEITVSLPRELAQTLCDALSQLLGDDEDGDLEGDLEDGDEFGAMDYEEDEEGVDPGSALTKEVNMGKQNKVGNLKARGAAAARGASSKIDAGSAHSKEVNMGKQNKVGNLKVGKSAFE